MGRASGMQVLLLAALAAASQPTIAELRSKMTAASAAEDYALASKLKKQLRELEQAQAKKGEEGAPDKDSDGLLVLTDSNFERETAAADVMLVEFYAPWCGVCRKLAPELAKAAKTLAAATPPILTAKIDAATHKRVGEKYSVTGFPTLKVFSKGEVLPVSVKADKGRYTEASIVGSITGHELVKGRAAAGGGAAAGGDDLAELQRRMKEASEKEDYAAAARLRDRINAAKQRSKTEKQAEAKAPSDEAQEKSGQPSDAQPAPEHVVITERIWQKLQQAQAVSPGGSWKSFVEQVRAAAASADKPRDESPKKRKESKLNQERSVPGRRTKYTITTEGSGRSVKKGDKVTVHATGTVKETGKKFWSTHDKGQRPFTYAAGQGTVIPGWDEGVLAGGGMRVGEHRRLVIPGSEGYKEGNAAWGIPKMATLDFVIEVTSIA